MVKKSKKEEGMLKNNVMSQTNSIQSKQKIRIGYRSNDSKEIIEGIYTSDDSFVDDPEANSPLRNPNSLLLSNTKSNYLNKNVTPLKNRRIQKNYNR